MEMAETQEGAQTHQRQNNTETPYGFINSFTWNTFTVTFSCCTNGASGQKKSMVLISLHPDSFLQCEMPIAAEVTV